MHFILTQASQTCMSRRGILTLFTMATNSSEVPVHWWNEASGIYDFFKFYFFFSYKKSMMLTLLMILEE